jgi:pimeloyl-ACP methyl ester carboxylesterase
MMVARLALAGLYDQLGRALGREPYRVPAMAVPGESGMMISPDAVGITERLAGDRYEELLPENNVAARIALRVPSYSPGRSASKITAPALVQLAQHDEITPYAVALKAAKRLPKGEVLSYDCGHFDPYVDPLFDTVVSDQLDFLQRSV